MNPIGSATIKPSIIFNRTNLTELTELYFSPNTTAKPWPSASPSQVMKKTMTISYQPTPSVIAKPSVKVYPSYSPKKNNTVNLTATLQKIPSVSMKPTPTSSSITAFRKNDTLFKHHKYTYIQLGFLVIVLLVFYYFINRCNRFVIAKMKKKVDIRVPVIIPEERVMEGAASRPTPPNSGGKSPRFMTVQKDCEV
jgi:hypothetical protein